MTHREISRTQVMRFVIRLLARGMKRLPRLLLLPLCLCALAAFLLTPPAQTRAQSCTSCDKNKARVGFTGSVCSTQGFTVSLNGAAVGGTGNCTADTWVTTHKTYTELQVDRTYQLTVGTGSCSTHVVFDVPEGYTLEINGVKTNTIDVGGTAKGSGDGSWNVVVRKCKGCESTQSGEACEVQIGSVDWSVSLGTLSDGRWARAIGIHEDSITPAVYTPSALVYSSPGQTNEVDVVRNQDGSLRQIKFTQGLADIVVISGQEYDIHFYSPASVGAKAGGVYPVSGQPSLSWKIKNPDPATTSRLQISKTQNGATETYDYALDAASGTWSLAEGGGEKVTTKLVAFVSPTSRVETTVVKDAAGRVASKVARTYHTFPWGEELLSEVQDPNGAALTTSYAYYEDPAEAGRHTKLKSVSFPDGSWEKYDYYGSGKKSLVLRPWKDTPLDAATEGNSHAVYYTYSNFDGVQVSLYADLISSVVEKIAGTMVRKTTYARTGVTLNGEPAVAALKTEYASASVTAATVTTAYHSSASAFLANRVASVLHPDGTKDSYSYEKGNYVSDADPSLSRFTPDANGAAERTSVIRGNASSPDGVAFKSAKEVSVRDQFGRLVLQETYVLDGAAYARTAWSVKDYDGRGHLILTRSSNGVVATATWGGDLMTASVDEEGVETVYTYDSLRRVKTQTRKGLAAGAFPAQADIVTTFTYDAEGRRTGETVTGGGLSLGKSVAYDAAGRIKRATEPADPAKSETEVPRLATTYTYANGGRTETVTLPGGATRVTDKYLDGQAKSVTGTAVVAQYFDYGVNADGTRYSQAFTGGPSSPRWAKRTTDWLGRTVKAERPGFTGANLVQTYAYNDKGQLQAESLLSGGVKLLADKLYEYDELGNRVRVGSDLDASGTLTPASTDRIAEMEALYEKSGNDWFMVTNVKTYLVNNSDAPAVRTRRERLTGFAAGPAGQTVSEEAVADMAGNVTRTTTSVDRAARKLTVTTDTPDSDTDAVSVSVNGLLQSSSPTTPASATTYAYDALGRQTAVTDPRTGTTTKSYSPTTGQLISTGDAVQTADYEYYPAPHASAGRLKSQANAAGKKVYFNYNSRGELTQTWGDAAYPLEYVYDAFGQRAELRTFRGGQNWGAGTWPGSLAGTADVTRWVYQDSTGLLTQKQDAAGKQVVYTYDALGRLGTRTWARAAAAGGALTTTYAYDPQTGELSGIDYSDATPDVTYGYDRGGRQSSITDAAGEHTRTFNARGELETDLISGGILSPAQVSVTYDQYLRRQFLQSSHSATVLTSQTHTYDAASRAGTVTAVGHTATYAYHPTSGLLNTTTFSGGAQVSRGYDSLGRLQTISAAAPATGVAASYAYTYNSLHQRTKVTREDGSYWTYSYNDRGELTSGKKSWADGTPVWGSQTEYSFDPIGNRTASGAGGNQLGQLRPSVYAANALNQYTQRTNPGAADITGAANSAAAVSVNGQPAARKGDYFYKELPVDNSAGSVSAQVSVVGARQNFGAGGEDAVAQRGGRVFVPPAAETYTYDADGNLTRDGRWAYTWDAENRLASMEALPQVPADAKLRLEFAYDHAGRRIQKKVYAWSDAAGTYQLGGVSKFLYDGWTLLAELDGNNALVRGYTWDAGRLLFIRDGGVTYQAAYDGQENVTALINAATGALAASYDYDTFGNTLKAAGEYASRNPIKFSGQYEDGETGLLYYGYRYFNPQTGRWISRDPSEERGGHNLYGFVGNDGANGVDFLGLWKRGDIWSGRRFRYSGVAVAEDCDTLSRLAYLITGDENDWKLLRSTPNVKQGERVNIAPLLSVFERRLRTSVRRATKAFKANFGAPAGDVVVSDSSREEYINNTFFGPTITATTECYTASDMVLFKGLIDVLKPGEYDQVYEGLAASETGLFDFFQGYISEMIEGDQGHFPNFPEYKEYGDVTRDPWQGENVVKIGRDSYWGHGNDGPLSKLGWEGILRRENNNLMARLGRPQRAPGERIPAFAGREKIQIKFWNVAAVAMEVFKIRNR